MTEEAGEEDTIIPAAEDSDSYEEFNPFEEMSSEYKPSEIRKVIGEDGLPTQVTSDNKSDIPPLSCETLVCMGDYSKFVSGTDEFDPADVKMMPDGSYRAKHLHGTIPVYPIRRPCDHYVRQIVQLEHNPEHRLHLRLCSARRTTEGAFMSIRDTAVWACSMRRPRDIKTEQMMDDFDKKKAEEGERRVSRSIFSKGK